jgi:Lanthionine synthetase C-like protein
LACQAAKLDHPRRLQWLAAAAKGGESVFRRGLLKKGLSLCHGISGNGYTFLYLYGATGDARWLLRAKNFLEFSTTLHAADGRSVPLTGDAPYSLYTGVAGTLPFCCDILDDRCEFPLFDCSIRSL